MIYNYITLCLMNDTGVTHLKIDRQIYVQFSRHIKGKIHRLNVTIDGRILYSNGFKLSEIVFCLNFLNHSRRTIIMESNGEI